MTLLGLATNSDKTASSGSNTDYFRIWALFALEIFEKINVRKMSQQAQQQL